MDPIVFTLIVQARQAQAEMAKMQKQVQALERSVAQANRTMAMQERSIAKQNAALSRMQTRLSGASTAQRDHNRQIDRGIPSLSRWGNQVQWAGRQLQYNFSLPIAIAGGAAIKFALDNERAMVRIQKVYGDAGHDADFYKQEIEALGGAFERMSEKFGVAQSEVLDVAAAWAAAGSSGLALAKQTDLTMQTMILGEMGAAEATEALIAIQAQYRLNTEELTNVLSTLNMVENQTGISLKGLVQGFQRAAGVAADAGVPVRNLAGFLAALTPATGSAVNAGNALKTIISRLMNPTKDAAAILGEMGINTREAAWQSMSATDRIEKFAEAYQKLNGAQKSVAASTIAGVYQVSRQSQLMNEVTSKTGYYAKALGSTKSGVDNHNQRLKELNKVLESNPAQLQQMWREMQNLMAKAVVPLIPHLVHLLQVIVDFTKKFGELPDSVQYTIMALLGFLAIIGPIARYVGSVANLFGLLKEAILFSGKAFGKVGGTIKKVFLAPFAAVGGMLGGITGKIKGAGKGIQSDLKGLFNMKQSKKAPTGPFAAMFNKLPKSIRKDLRNAKKEVDKGARALYGRLPDGMRNALASMKKVWQGGWKGVRASMLKGASQIGPLLARAFVSIPAIPALFATMNAQVVAGMAWLAATFRANFGLLFPVFGRAKAAIGRLGATLWRGLLTPMPSVFAAIRGLAVRGFSIGILAPMEIALRGSLVAMRGWAIGLLVAAKSGIMGLPAIFFGAFMRANAAMMRGFAAAPGLIKQGIQKLWKQAVRFGPVLIRAFARVIPLFLRFLTSWWGLAITAALGLIYHFRDEIANAWNGVVSWFQQSVPGLAKAWDTVVEYFDKAVDWIVKAFWRLPDGVTDAVIQVLTIIKQVALQVYEWFSYLNPWARHSPSLVESVQTGMAAVKSAYGSVGNVGAVFAKAAKDLKAFKTIASSLKQVEMDDQMAEIGKGLPSVLPLYKALIGDLKSLNVILGQQEAAVNQQQAVVDKWKDALEAANTALDKQQAKLDQLESALTKIQDVYDAHEAALASYADAPIAGMGAMEDAIFANELAQKKLRLEMLKMEEQAGGGVDDIRDRLAALQGDIENLRGEAADLRSAGAGSDVLGPIMAEIQAMEAQRDALASSVGGGGTVSELERMQKELDELAKKGEILSLEKDIQFDPMTRQIDKLANAQKEMSYDEIVAGINREKAAMAALEPQIAAATAAVNRQKLAVEQATAARDAINTRYDAESAKLDKLKDSYAATEAVIRDIESALNDMGTAASANISKAEEAATKARAAKDAAGPSLGRGHQNFLDAGAASDFPDVRGSGTLGREGGKEDQAGGIEAWSKENLDRIKKSFQGVDIFKPVKDAWNRAWAWMEQQYQTYIQPIVDGISSAFSSIDIDLPNPFKSTENWAVQFREIWETIKDIGDSAWGALKAIWRLFEEDLKAIWDELVKAGKQIWNEIGPELEKFGEPLSQIGKAFKGLWTVLKPVVAIIGGALLLALKVAANIISQTLGPVLDGIIDIVKSVIKVIRGLVEFVIGVFSGDWEMAWQGIKDMLAGTWDAIFAIFEGAVQTLWGIIKGLVEGVWDFFKWLWNELVGHSIIPDIVNDIIDWFKQLPGRVWNAVKDFATKVKDRAIEAGKAFWDWTTKKFTEVIDWIAGRPKAIWDKMVALKTYLSDVAKMAWQKFKDEAAKKFSEFFTWVTGRPQAIWDKMIALKTKLGDIAQKAWQYFKDEAGKKWTTIATWIGGLPQAAYNKIITMKDKLSSAAKSAMDAFKNKAKEIFDGKSGILSWFGGLPGRIAEKLKGIGSTVANAVKSSWNTAANWINDKGIRNVNKVTSKFGLTLQELPRFAKGGVVPGTMTTRDSVVAMLRPQEGVLIPEAVKALGGAAGLARFNESAKRGHVPREQDYQAFRKGGVVGTGDGVTDWLAKGAGFALDKILAPLEWGIRAATPPPEVMEKWTAGWVKQWRTKAKEWGNAKDTADKTALGSTELGGIGYARMVNILLSRFPDLAITSTYRPGAITASGNRSYHSMGRAVDMSPRMDVFNWLASTYGKTSKELIFSPAGVRQIKNGSPYYYGEPVRGMHWDHVHWAYDQGGILQPGMTLAKNATGKDELVLTNSDMMALSNVLSMMDRMVAKSGTGATPGAAAVRSMGATMSSLEARLRARESENGQMVRSGEGNTTINIYGDLSLPNIKSGDDADLFIRHLKTLAG